MGALAEQLDINLLLQDINLKVHVMSCVPADLNLCI
jgi:hypothetical protein